MLRITPTALGNFLVQCSQLCGFNHTGMTAPVYVVTAAQFADWVKQQQPAVTPTPAPTTQEVTIDLTAQNMAFDKSTITVPAGAGVMINFFNKDNNVPHNFSVYTDSTASKAIFTGKIITGVNSAMYMFQAPTTPGKYFFRCDVHPTTMTGEFIVQ
jgi:heme/copper-type cytochrome/quinol oxidase subunit 2